MIRRWLHVRIRAAQQALQEGRLDEAYTAAMENDVRKDKRGQRLLDELVRPLIARARLALQAGRYRDALADLDRLSAAERSMPEAEALRRRVIAELRVRDAKEGQRAAAAVQAAQRVAEGRLDTGRLAVAALDDTLRRAELQQELDVRQRRIGELLSRANEALERGQLLAAVQAWREARDRHGVTSETDAFAARLAPAVQRILAESLAAGQLDRLQALRPALEPLEGFAPDLVSYGKVAALCVRAADQLAARSYDDLRNTLLRIRSGQRDIQWVEEALSALAQLQTAQATLLASPLGLYASMRETAPPAIAEADVRENDGRRPAATAAANQGEALGRLPLLLLVDGIGSSLLLARDRCIIGRAGSRRPVDIPVPADLQSQHAEILREGSDYFLNALGPTKVNGRVVRRTLLHDGDRIVLNGAAKFVFRKPSTRSDSAVLSISHRCRLPEDVSSVLLFRDTALIGPSPSCHLRAQSGEYQLVLFERGGRLHAREAAAAGGKLGDAHPLELGQTRDFGEIRITVKPYEHISA